MVWQAPKSTRKRRYLTVPRICVFEGVAFSGVFWRPVRGEQRAPENATHPKTQILGTVRYLRFWVCCVFGCSLFSSEHWWPSNWRMLNSLSDRGDGYAHAPYLRSLLRSSLSVPAVRCFNFVLLRHLWIRISTPRLCSPFGQKQGIEKYQPPLIFAGSFNVNSLRVSLS